MRLSAILLLFASALASLTACSEPESTPDAGTSQTTLEVLGDSIGLEPASDVELRVRYRGPESQPVVNAAVTFELIAGPLESVAGATLSASVAGTSADGIASVFLTAGAESTNFRVRVTAAGAAPAFFFIAVSTAGFATFQVSAEHRGARDESAYGNIEYRLFDPRVARCVELDIDALPDSVLPPRRASSFDEQVVFSNLVSQRDYTVLTWGENERGGTRLGFGCVELVGAQVTPGPPLDITAPLTDRALRWDSALAITSVFVLPSLVSAIDAAVSPDPWRALECELGPSQLLLDCILDAETSDGDLDCVPTAASDITNDVNALRGPEDGAGCRASERSPNVPSLDRLLLDEMNAGPWTAENAAALAIAERQLMSGLTIESTIEVSAAGVATHALDRVRIASANGGYEENLAGSSRANVQARAVATHGAAAGELVFGDHGFTLDLERTLASAFEGELLPSRGLDGRQADLGAALVESHQGCAVISEFVCSATGRPTACLQSACEAAATTLDGRLRLWLSLVQAGGIDFRIGGAAVASDDDFDLVVDAIGEGAEAASGEWSAVLETGGASVVGAGAFGGP